MVDPIEEKLTIEYHDELNPLLWDGDRLKPEVRKHLRLFAKVWLEQVEIIQPKDVIDVTLTGGNANYNYTSFSDIDVHIIVDKSKLPIKQPWLDSFLQDKKKLWQLTHKDTIYGLPLEPYAQDVKQTHKPGQGVFSLLHNRWISEPEHGDYDTSSNDQIEAKADYYESFVAWLIRTKASSEILLTIKNKIHQMRSNGLDDSGEFSPENLLFKELRNRGVLENISQYLIQKTDDMISLR